MISDIQIRELISAYVQDGDADKFALEFSKLSFCIHYNGSSSAIELADRVQAQIAEVYLKHATRDSLREWLRAYLDGSMPVAELESHLTVSIAAQPMSGTSTVPQSAPAFVIEQPDVRYASAPA